MPTQHQHRICLLVPAGAKVTAVAAWLASNIDPNTDPLLGPGLSATGAAPATFRWCAGAYTDAEAKAILLRLCTLASVAAPTNAQWNGWTRAQKRTWLLSVQAAIFAGFGAWVWLADNEGAWDEAEAVLTAAGLLRVGA